MDTKGNPFSKQVRMRWSLGHNDANACQDISPLVHAKIKLQLQIKMKLNQRCKDKIKNTNKDKVKILDAKIKMS